MGGGTTFRPFPGKGSTVGTARKKRQGQHLIQQQERSMSALRRNIIRHGKFAAERGAAHGRPGQINRHIIVRAIRNCRTRKHGNKTIHHGQGGLYPMELHATKGWRYVRQWSA